jgi:hypothetical protein
LQQASTSELPAGSACSNGLVLAERISVMEVNNDEKYYEFYERVAILLENNPGMTEETAKKQAADELRLRKKTKIERR